MTPTIKEQLEWLDKMQGILNSDNAPMILAIKENLIAVRNTEVAMERLRIAQEQWDLPEPPIDHKTLGMTPPANHFLQSIVYDTLQKPIQELNGGLSDEAIEHFQSVHRKFAEFRDMLGINKVIEYEVDLSTGDTMQILGTYPPKPMINIQSASAPIFEVVDFKCYPPVIEPKKAIGWTKEDEERTIKLTTSNPFHIGCLNGREKELINRRIETIKDEIQAHFKSKKQFRKKDFVQKANERIKTLKSWL